MGQQYASLHAHNHVQGLAFNNTPCYQLISCNYYFCKRNFLGNKVMEPIICLLFICLPDNIGEQGFTSFSTVYVYYVQLMVLRSVVVRHGQTWVILSNNHTFHPHTIKSRCTTDTLKEIGGTHVLQ